MSSAAEDLDVRGDQLDVAQLSDIITPDVVIRQIRARCLTFML
jgi:hypothetical protein